MEVESTIRPAKGRIAGFEGREGHRTPFAPVVCKVFSIQTLLNGRNSELSKFWGDASRVVVSCPTNIFTAGNAIRCGSANSWEDGSYADPGRYDRILVNHDHFSASRAVGGLSPEECQVYRGQPVHQDKLPTQQQPCWNPNALQSAGRGAASWAA